MCVQPNKPLRWKSIQGGHDAEYNRDSPPVYFIRTDDAPQNNELPYSPLGVILIYAPCHRLYRVRPWHSTKDFHSFERNGVIMQPVDKDAALLPHKIDGCLALIHHPVTGNNAHVWISYSSDQRNCSGYKKILEACLGGWWTGEQNWSFTPTH